MSEKKDVGKGKGQTKAVDPHALYAGGAQPAGAGGGGIGQDHRGELRNGKHKHQQQNRSQPQQQQQQQQQPYQSDGSGVVGPSCRLDPAYWLWRWDDSRSPRFGSARDVTPMGYIPVQPPPGAQPSRSPPPAGLGPPRRRTAMPRRLCFRCQQPGHYAAQCTTDPHAHANVTLNSPPTQVI